MNDSACAAGVGKRRGREAAFACLDAKTVRSAANVGFFKPAFRSFQHFDYHRNMEMNSAVRALGALAQVSRLGIFRLLVEAGPAGLAAGQIGERLEIAPSSLSFHMKELSHAGLASVRQQGRFMIYSANFSVMNDLLGFLTENCCAGNPCLPAAGGCATPDEGAA